MAEASWVACECDRSPCICCQPMPQIGPTDSAEAHQLQRGLAATIGATSAWLANYIETHGDELAEVLSRPAEELIREALEAKRRERLDA